jgi:serine protease Do
MSGEIVGATSEESRLAISRSPVAPDALSAAFACASETVEPSVVHLKVLVGGPYARQGVASGLVVDKSGFILTNQHVIERAVRIKVKLASGNEYDAKVVGQDSETDLAVIKIEAGEPLVVPRIGDSDKLRVGDWVLAIGSPLGLEQTVTAGIISAKDRVADTDAQSPFQQFLQTDAAINPGNSGGPLVNLAGEVVGINTLIASNSGYNSGIGLALPSSTFVEVYNELAAAGRVRRGFLGITPQEITPQVARLNNITDGSGVVVRDLTSRSGPAANAGLKSGDVITNINGRAVKGVRDLIRRVASLPVGSCATINYVRNGEPRATEAVIEERKEAPVELDPGVVPLDPRNPAATTEPKENVPKKQTLGIRVRTLSTDLAKREGLEGAEGLYITGVEPGSVAYDNDVRVEDFIVEMNNSPVTSEKEFRQAVRELKSGDDLVIKVLRRERGAIRQAYIISFTMP